MTDSLEHLEEEARLGCVFAQHLCRTRVGDDHCGALHGAWTDLRRLGLAAEPARHAGFYAQTLGAYARSGHSRVLVAGCADSGMLEIVDQAWRAAPARLDVTVGDRCPTPLLLCAWYGARVGLPVRSAMAELAEWRDADPFDVVCTHSLLAYGDAAWRRRLVGNWSRSLRPGGVVVTVTRLASAPNAHEGDCAARLASAARERAAQLGLPLDARELTARVERFARAQSAHPVGDAVQLRALFEAQGFHVDRLDTRSIDGPDGEAADVSGIARGGLYGEIVAVRT
jgi:SAM-dependent methyltransferase